MMKIYTQGQSSLRYGVKNATLLCNYCSVCVYVWQNKRKMILQLGKNCQPLCLVTVSAIKMRTYTQDEAKALTNSWLTKQALHPPPPSHPSILMEWLKCKGNAHKSDENLILLQEFWLVALAECNREGRGPGHAWPGPCRSPVNRYQIAHTYSSYTVGAALLCDLGA